MFNECNKSLNIRLLFIKTLTYLTTIINHHERSNFFYDKLPITKLGYFKYGYKLIL